MNKEKILGFDVCIDSEKELLNNIFEDYNKNKQVVIASVNPEIVTSNYKNNSFIEQINSLNYQIPDGIGIIYASKINHGNIKTRITGIDLMLKICEESIKYNSKIFLYGSKKNIGEKAKFELEQKYSNINIAGICDGYVPENIAIENINNSNADILFVGLGNPKQENFILNHKDELKNVKIFMPIGGSLDVISNTLKRAPRWMIKHNLEWLYRLIQQPKRIFRHFRLVKFMFLVLIKKNKRGKK